MFTKKSTCVSAAAALMAIGTAHAQTIATNNPPATPKWDSSVALGATLTRGNSDSTTVSGSAATERKWDGNDLLFGGDGLYGVSKQNGTTTENAETLHGFTQYNRNFTERLYGYARLDLLHDGIADIRYRVTLSPGLGYYFVKTKETDFSLEAGPGYITQHIGDRYQSYATLRIGEKFHHALTEHSRIWQTAEFLPQVDYFRNYIINAEVGVEADINKKGNLATRFVIDDTYNSIPAVGRVPNDAKLIASIVYKF